MKGGLRAGATAFTSALLTLIGLILIVEAALAGGRLGFLLGVLFLLAGALRLYLSRRI
jgi:hypothetical protein